ncbi:MAG TPA: hypothetical protein PKK74_00950 [Candidatus Methanoculleus thermohydrogenotrophicum]|jgi:hypothetical protein|nr:hypothetical protein [Candidatus Methanoculleus thermohydrogenotrophicum]NLM82055.1 hypothetical protein [Candidatus Methanoculleus thermohydrogenotrophicum]HOB17253.1 hypothetical protein [Candidatus Methanoculleus thermohydrogenotrophicum]HPZ37462.1 hypothetical protein [Candidatus Methanoculleus thermohydrogenotrophicum]HQC90861.1 hypothetical protein [Candidatus Methanoculleus thermohydrogenotrophicum]
MEIRELIGDITLTIVMVVSTVVLVMRFWQDLIIVVAATFMMLSLGGLLISLGLKIVRLEQSVAQRERTMRVNMEEIEKAMSAKYDNTMSHIEEIVDGLSRRMYR